MHRPKSSANHPHFGTSPDTENAQATQFDLIRNQTAPYNLALPQTDTVAALTVPVTLHQKGSTASMLIDVPKVVQLHRSMVVRWHERGEIDVPFDGIEGIICRQFTFNYLLWHEEDVARSPDVGDARIAAVKRAIDQYNQQRNDWMERIDDWITEELDSRGVHPNKDARLNTETPGSVIDRMSILSLRIYHLEEQAERDDVSREHIESVQQKLAICLEQLDDLSQSLAELLEDILAGRKRHKTYRHLKMYNDPELNPYLYRVKHRKAG